MGDTACQAALITIRSVAVCVCSPLTAIAALPWTQ